MMWDNSEDLPPWELHGGWNPGPSAIVDAELDQIYKAAQDRIDAIADGSAAKFHLMDDLMGDEDQFGDPRGYRTLSCLLHGFPMSYDSVAIVVQVLESLRVMMVDQFPMWRVAVVPDAFLSELFITVEGVYLGERQLLTPNQVLRSRGAMHGVESAICEWLL